MQRTFTRGSTGQNMNVSPRRSFQTLLNQGSTAGHSNPNSMHGAQMYAQQFYSGNRLQPFTEYQNGREESLGAHSHHSNDLNRTSFRSPSVSEEFVGWPISSQRSSAVFTPSQSSSGSSSPTSSMPFTPTPNIGRLSVDRDEPPSSMPAASTPSDSKSSSRRGANFDEESLNQLCVSWLHVSQSALTGNDQQASVFWDKVTKHFNENVSEGNRRSQKSVMSRWSTLNRCMARFAGCLEQIKKLKESGKSPEDQVTDALILYKSDCTFNFKDMSSYNIVKYAPKWQQNPFYLEHCGHSKAKLVADHSDMDLGSDYDSLPRMDRPMGSKKAKRGRSSLAEEIMPQILENSTSMATSTKDIAAQGREAQSTLQSMLEFAILSANTAGLDEITRAEIEARRARIIAQSRATREAEDL